jgi:hypothetical protein
MPSFPFDKVCGTKLRWFRHNEEDDVGSIIYAPNVRETQWLKSKLIEEATADASVTDMSALKRIRVKNFNRVEVFPDIFFVDGTEFNRDVFDGLALGQYLFGMDQRNTYGIEILRENNVFSCTPNSEKLASIVKDMNLDIDSSGVAKGVLKVTKFSLHSFHVHSKNIALFQISNTREMNNYLKLNFNEVPYVKTWNLTLLCGLLRDNFRNNSLIPYLYHMFKFLRKRTEYDSHSRMKALLLFFRRKWKIR